MTTLDLAPCGDRRSGSIVCLTFSRTTPADGPAGTITRPTTSNVSVRTTTKSRWLLPASRLTRSPSRPSRTR